jgi:hypothetical protein
MGSSFNGRTARWQCANEGSTPSDSTMMFKYEVVVIYSGARTYQIEAASMEEAEEKARVKHMKGKNKDNTGADHEVIDLIDARPTGLE